MSRKLFIAGNWKMNHNRAETKAMLAAFCPAVKDVVGKLDIAVCPTFTSLDAAREVLAGTGIQLGAQNVHWAESGAFTGEIAASMLKEVPVDFAIIGHSERRQYFGETDATVNQRLKACLNAGLAAIVCVGETLDERKAGQVESVVSRQVREGLAGIDAASMARVTIAYEPVWAIGTGETATPQQAQEVHALIRKLLAELFGQEVADQIRIQYGGSVKPDNVQELMAQPDIDGALVGGASLKADSFSSLIHNALK
ncbi:MAG: triose-phosphate isomerase [Lentisphaerae bacterium]|nr:MAG: triose-phosphate isomerase [Lentisphaerota bacterium]